MKDEREDERQEKTRTHGADDNSTGGAELSLLIVLSRGINLTIQCLNCHFSIIIN